jgi:cellulose synthase/poly-beta-1,6-N-acetylglucosamine synthase-like glycosyltransferase
MVAGSSWDKSPEIELSVVMPCRNESTILHHQLDALVAQNWPGSWEIVVADNGSTDGTADVALSYRARLPHLEIVNASARAGRHHACNVGAAAARGAVIVFLDADDVVEPGYLGAMAFALRQNAVVAARLDHAALDATWMAGVGSGVQTTTLQEGFGFLPYGAGCSLGFRRDAFEAIGGFREDATYCEDVDICWRAQLAGYQIDFVPDAVVQYRSRPTVMQMYRQHRNYGRARAFLYREFRTAGMPPRTGRDFVADWFAISKSVVACRSKGDAAAVARRLGRSVGRLEGNFRYRVWYP